MIGLEIRTGQIPALFDALSKQLQLVEKVFSKENNVRPVVIFTQGYRQGTIRCLFGH